MILYFEEVKNNYKDILNDIEKCINQTVLNNSILINRINSFDISDGDDETSELIYDDLLEYLNNNIFKDKISNDFIFTFDYDYYDLTVNCEVKDKDLFSTFLNEVSFKVKLIDQLTSLEYEFISLAKMGEGLKLIEYHFCDNYNSITYYDFNEKYTNNIRCYLRKDKPFYVNFHNDQYDKKIKLLNQISNHDISVVNDLLFSGLKLDSTALETYAIMFDCDFSEVNNFEHSVNMKKLLNNKKMTLKND